MLFIETNTDQALPLGPVGGNLMPIPTPILKILSHSVDQHLHTDRHNRNRSHNILQPGKAIVETAMLAKIITMATTIITVMDMVQTEVMAVAEALKFQQLMEAQQQQHIIVTLAAWV